MTEYKCVVCKMPILVLEDKLGNGDASIGRCVHSNCVMSSIWLPVEALDEIERLQARVQEVEDNREHIERLLCNAEKRVQELKTDNANLLHRNSALDIRNDDLVDEKIRLLERLVEIKLLIDDFNIYSEEK